MGVESDAIMSAELGPQPSLKDLARMFDKKNRQFSRIEYSSPKERVAKIKAYVEILHLSFELIDLTNALLSAHPQLLERKTQFEETIARTTQSMCELIGVTHLRFVAHGQEIVLKPFTPIISADPDSYTYV